MASNFLPGGLPPPLDPILEVPTPQIPDADFVSIGAGLAKGVKDSGTWDWLLNLILKWIPWIIGKIVGTLMGLLLMVAANFVRLFFQVFHNAGFGVDTLAAELIGGLFGVQVSSSAFAQFSDHASREHVAVDIGEAIMEGLSGFTHGGSGGPLTASAAGADKFLKTVLEMEMTGWSQDMLMELVSFGHITAVEHLREAMEQGLGIGNLSRRVLGVPVNTLVVQPFQYLVNERYRPTLLSVDLVVKQFMRNLINRGQLDQELAWRGYTPERIEALINAHTFHLSVEQIVTLRRQAIIDDFSYGGLLQDIGIPRATANLISQSHEQAHRHGLKMQLANHALELFRKAEISGAQLDPLISDIELSSDEIDYFHKIADFTVLGKRTLLSLSQGTELVTRGIWTISQFHSLAASHGYDANDAFDLELLLLSKVQGQAETIAAREARAHAKALADQAKAAETIRKAAAALVEEQVHGVSISRYETLVLDGLKTMADYTTFLTNKGLAADNVAAFAAHLQLRVNRAGQLAAGAGGAAASARKKQLSISQLERAVKSGALTMAEYSTRLTTAGVAAPDVAILVDILIAELDKAAVRDAAIAAAHQRSLHHGLNLHEEQLAVRQGFRTVADYQTFLSAAGYDDPDATILVAQMNALIAADAAARALRAAPLPAGAAKGLNLAQMERAVRAGVVPIANYTAELVRAGYDANAQAALTSLLQMRVDQDARTAAIRGQAQGALAARGLTLSDVERAVKARVLPMSAYTDALTRAGVDAASANVLALTLAAGIKAVTTPAAVAASASKLVSAAGFSLAKLESDVVAGRLGLPAFSAVLSGAGVAQGDITRIAGVLQLELDQKAAAAALLGQATQRATSRDLSLTQEIAAVKVGVQGLPDYSALAAKLGYDPVEVQILAATLEAQLAAAPGPAVP